jgi:hypothetical protein
MIQLINESEVLRTWSPIIESTTGITAKDRLAWMSKYAHFHQLYESAHNYVHLNPDMNINGMNAVTLPGNPSSITGFSGQATGSGDKPYSLLPLAMQVAAQTIGLDLIPVVPMPGPLGILTYLDFHYGNGRLDSNEAPLIIKVPTSFISGSPIQAFTENAVFYINTGAGATGNLYQATYLVNSRIDDYAIFKIVPTETDGTLRAIGAPAIKPIAYAVSNGALYTSAAGSTQVADFTGAAELVKALEDHVEGFAGKRLRLGATDKNEPYSRGEGESTPENIMGLTLYNKSVEAKTYQVAAAVTREQVQDLKQYGIDAVAQIESVLINELTQSINKLILDRLFQLGGTNHTRAGINLNLNFGTTASNIYLGKGEDGMSLPGLNTQAENLAVLGGENKGSVQRRILSKILAAANVIAIRGRRGAANFAVTNGQVATALQDIAGFVPYPLSNTINQSAGSLYPVGSVAGVNIYVDPNMGWDDTRVVVGRKNDSNGVGVTFMPYLMAESVQTIAEGTLAPKIGVKSRFALVDAGQHPETQYITLKIQTGANFSSLV